MADFQVFFPTLLRFEGGYVDDPHDPGGATNMGITLPIFQRHAPTLLHLAPTLEGLRRMTKEHAGIIYKVEFWDAVFGDDIAYQPLANDLFDFYVNAGHHAITLFYQVLNAQGTHFDVRMGMTRTAVESLRHHDMAEVYAAFREGRMAYYRILAGKHPILRRYLKGWLRRADSFPQSNARAIANHGDSGITEAHCPPA